MRFIPLFFVLFAITAVSPAAADDGPPRKSELTRVMEKDVQKTVLRMEWRGVGTNLRFPDFLQAGGEEMKREFGMTDEQIEMLDNIGADMDPDAYPGIENDFARMQELHDVNRDLTVIPDDLRKELATLHETVSTRVMMKFDSETGDLLTPEQKHKFGELQIALMSVTPFPNPGMFEVLDLSEEQRQQLDAIKKELDPEFERVLDQVVERMFELSDEIEAAIGDSLENLSPEEAQKKREEIQRKFLAEHPGHKKSLDEMFKTCQAFTDKLKFRMYDILTDAQMGRLRDLIEHPPAYAKTILEKIRKELGESDDGPEKSINLNVWKPGDPIPEEYVQQRKVRFPKKSQKVSQ